MVIKQIYENKTIKTKIVSKKNRNQNIELLFEHIDLLQEKEERTMTKPNSKG
ncbi:hypothetical protein M472_11255 [Sphingobacterium paucimobilis HER1398]|uniref:Uncharacterized protein n=1 Tax=Sphingobacterium paucimobilis HER1398 TaxID=1346330 RepID=U2HVP7_9SPHI|nr:hypothetical protein M472_11255 [Sphingobacterium paucimobilis HER1398]